MFRGVYQCRGSYVLVAGHKVVIIVSVNHKTHVET